LGASLGTISLGGIVYGLIESANLGFRSPLVLGALIGGVGALMAFVFVEARVRFPMMPLALFRSRDFAGANMLTLFLYAALAGTLFFVPLNLIQVQGYNPTKAGAALLPFILIMFLMSRWSGGLVKRYGSRLPLVVGPTIAAIGFALFVIPNVGGTYWKTFFPPMAVLGLGMAITVAPLTTTVMNSVKQSHAGIASGINNAVSRTAGLLAVAVLGVIMFQTFNTCLDYRLGEINMPQEARNALSAERVKLAAMQVPAGVNDDTKVAIEHAIDECFISGFRRLTLIGAALAFGSSLIALVMLRGRHP